MRCDCNRLDEDGYCVDCWLDTKDDYCPKCLTVPWHEHNGVLYCPKCGVIKR